MAGTSIVIENTASPALARIVGVAERPGAIMRDVGGYILFSTQRRFETETGPDGAKWQRLSPRTAKARIGRRRARGADHILRLSNRLYKSLTMQSDDNSAQVGTNVEYAAIHQFGGEIEIAERRQSLSLKEVRGSKRSRFVRAGTKGATIKDATIGAHIIPIPARPYLGINDADREEIGVVAVEALRREADL